MSDRPSLNVKWIIIGAAVIIGLNQILTLAIAQPTYDVLLPGLGHSGALYALTAILAVGSFFVGGLLVGWMSPGTTLLEPAIASAAGIIINGIFYSATNGPMGLLGMIGLLVAAGLGFGLGLAGAKVGERIQGDTTDKMRERGELPPS